MYEMDNADAKLIPFLRNLADCIEKRSLLPKQMQHIGEFFMSYQFQEQAIKDKDTSDDNMQLSDSDLLKFIIMGWHIYSCIVKGNDIPTNEDPEMID
jgi:hypothetical protein